MASILIAILGVAKLALAGFALTNAVGEKSMSASKACLTAFMTQQQFGISSRNLDTRIFIIYTMCVLNCIAVSVIVLAIFR